MSHFEKLKVWEKAVNLSVRIYEITGQNVFLKDFGLRDQMRKASVSIPSNIAEGDQLESDRSSVRHLRISKGSTAELLTQSIIASRINYLNNSDFEFIKKECNEIMGMLGNLIKYRSKG